MFKASQVYTRAQTSGAAQSSSWRKGQPGDQVLRGNFMVEEPGFSLQVHVTDALELDSNQLQVELPPALTICLLLEGQIDAMLGVHPLHLSAKQDPVGFSWAQRQALSTASQCPAW